jgi:Ion channel
VITIALQGAILLAALWISQARTGRLRVATVLVVAITAGSALAFAASGDADAAGARIMSFLLVAFAPVAILHGVVEHFRAERRVTLQTVFGVLCIYLLIGMMFAFTYGVIDDLSSAPFFAQLNGEGTTSDYLYFSFTTMTTTGYGDLTAAGDLGRSLAITEQLIGQIYMVTVVALIVGNLRRPAPQRSP